MKKTVTIVFCIVAFIAMVSITNKCYAVTENKTTNATTSAKTVNTTNTTNTSNTTVNTTTKKTTSILKSNNANLTTLGVTPKQYDFKGFTKDKTSYSITVPNDVSSLHVAYKTESSKAKVKITGNTSLEVGTNVIKILVTAENGNTKTYTIRVTKLATEDEKPGNLIDEDIDVDLYLTKLDIKGLSLTPEFKSNVFSYETTVDMDHEDMSSVTVETVANNEKATVEITGNENLVEGENLINIILKSPTTSEQTVYQITVNKVSTASEIIPDQVIETVKKVDKKYILIGAIAIVAIVAIVVLVIIAKRKKKDKKNYYAAEDDYYDDEEFENNDHHDVENLFNPMEQSSTIYETDMNQETLQEIQEETDRIFNKAKGETVSYYEKVTDKEDYIEKRLKKRKKGKHF